jgi:hypothetical protein
MLSVDGFKLRAAYELIELRDEVISLATDRNIYWKVQREVIQKNARLLTMGRAFFDMLNDSYAYATASRVRRLVDRDHRTISLRKIVDEIGSYPELLAEKLTLEDWKCDLARLDTTCDGVKDYVDQFVAHHDRSPTATVPTYRQLNEAIDTVIALFTRYYDILMGTNIDVVTGYLEDPLAIFAFPLTNAAHGAIGQPGPLV